MNAGDSEDSTGTPPSADPNKDVVSADAQNNKDTPPINPIESANLTTPADPEASKGAPDTQNDTDALAHAHAAADSAASSKATADTAAAAANQAQSAATAVQLTADRAAATHAKAIADATAASTEAKAAADAAKAAAAQAADAVKAVVPSDSHFYKYAGLYTTSLLVIATIMWLCYLPRRSAYPPTPEKELCAQLVEAEKVANPGNTGKALSGCPMQVQEGSDQKRVSFVRVAQSDLANSTQKGKNDSIVLNRIDELRNDLTVWNRYEEEFSDFRYGKDLNWYMHSTLRMLVLVLSAITPALIVAPLFAKKKFLAALPAAIVAIGTACLSEFDFKSEAASYETARVLVLGEKTAFITTFNPTYNYLSEQKGKKPAAAQAEQEQNKSTADSGKKTKSAANSREKKKSDNSAPGEPTAAQGLKSTEGCTEEQVPYPEPILYNEARANFACRIQQILQKRTGERDQFLRGGQSPKTTPQPSLRR